MLFKHIPPDRLDQGVYSCFADSQTVAPTLLFQFELCMTYDGVGGVTIDYNYLNLPRIISGTGGTLAKYSYLANGSKTSAENGSGAGLVYRDSLIYKKASNGTLTFDGVKSSASTSPARKTRPRTSPSRSRTSAHASTARPFAAGWSPTP